MPHLSTHLDTRIRTTLTSLLGLLALFTIPGGARNAGPDSWDSRIRTGSISGRITIEGTPAPGLTIEFLKDGPRDLLAVATTDEEGRYRATGLRSERYFVRVVAPRIAVGGNLTRWQVDLPGRVVSLATDESVTDVDVDLTIGGAVSGRVTDIDGNPVEGQWVQLVSPCGNRRGGWRRWMSAEPLFYPASKTDNSGVYRIECARPGQYCVVVGEDIARLTGAVMDRYDFGGTGRVGGSLYYAETFYPRVPEVDRAQIINVLAGSETENVSFAVGRSRKTYSATGRVINAMTGMPVTNARIWLYHLTGRRSFSGTREGVTNQDGGFTVTRLIPGNFFVSATFDDNVNLYAEEVDFQVTDADVTRLEVRATQGVTLTGIVEIPNKPSAAHRLPGLVVAAGEATEQPLSATHSRSFWRKAHVAPDGTFKITGLRGWDVRLYLDPDSHFSIVGIDAPSVAHPDATLTQSDSSANRVIRMANRVTRTAGNDVHGVRVTVALKNGVIMGRVTFTGGKRPELSEVNGTIGSNDYSGARGLFLDPNGYFFSEGLRPGDYTITIYGRNIPVSSAFVRVSEDETTYVSIEVDLSKQSTAER
jgi:5-hydroxyisourate hydrolase-like protein (transthyretin family)